MENFMLSFVVDFLYWKISSEVRDPVDWKKGTCSSKSE